MKLNAIEHPKTLDFASRLDVALPTAIGHLELLWAFTAKFTPCGDVGRFPSGAMARACHWPGDPATFEAALVSAGFLDRDPEHRLVVHDWHDHAPGWVRAKLAKTGQAFIGIQPKKTSGGSSEPTSDGSSERTSEPSTRAQIFQGKGREGKGERAAREARVGGPLSDGWEPDETGKAACTVRGLDPTAVLRKFRHWHRSKATSSADWSAEWLLWVDRERPPNGSAGPPKVKTPGQVAEDERLAKLAAVTAERFRAGGRA